MAKMSFLTFLMYINLAVIVNGGAVCCSYQAPPDATRTFKKAIEKTTKQKVQIDLVPLVPVDDKTYSRKLPKKKHSFSTIKNDSFMSFLPNDAMLTFSDKLRFESEMHARPPVTLPLFKSGVTNRFIPPHRNAIGRKRFGLDDLPSEYWFNNRIHSLGNTNLLGRLHSVLAPLATKLIDNAAYDGEDVRTRVSKDLRKTIDKPNVRILDLCCGVGMSTRSLSGAFQEDAEFICGIDTSPEMLDMARLITTYQEVLGHIEKFSVSNTLISDVNTLIRQIQLSLLLPAKKTSSKAASKVQSRKMFYARGNAERVKVPDNSFDIVTIMYAFHEIPKTARYRILREARRLLKSGGILAIIDISPDYSPSPAMLAGEPYLLEYKDNIVEQMKSLQGFSDVKSEVVVPDHVHKWLLTRKRNKKQ